MVELFRFTTDRFDPGDEEPNPINPIPGKALLAWLCAELRAQGHETKGPDPEDWGWFASIAIERARYMVGASGEPVSTGRVDWTLQIHRRVSLWERLRGANALKLDDPFIAVIESLLRSQSDLHHLERESER